MTLRAYMLLNLPHTHVFLATGTININLMNVSTQRFNCVIYIL